MGGRRSATEKLAAITLILLAVVSPLYIDRKATVESERGDEDEPGGLVPWLHLLLIFLIMAIIVSHFLDATFTRLDPYWIHRVGGSSCGMVAILLILALVLKCKHL